MIEQIKAESLKEIFIKQFEELILSGYFSIGEKLPSERDLAKKMGVSRPVVHEGLVDLASKGLVSMKPRSGTIVNDYRKEGSLAILTSLFEYNEKKMADRLLDSLLDMRMLFEEENARLAAANHTKEQMEDFKTILKQEKLTNHSDIEGITELDFKFHHLIAMSSGNMIYPLMINSLKTFYTNMSGRFFSVPKVVPVVFNFHKKLVEAFKIKDEALAAAIMKEMLIHGEKHLRMKVI